MVNRLVIDSSVAFKWFHQEDEGHVAEAAALVWRQHSGDVQLTAPPAVLLELANGLRYSRLDQPSVLAIIDAFGSLGIELVESTPTRVVRATELSYRFGMAVYDALFLQLAEELDCPLVTADRRAFAKIETGVEIQLL